MERLRAEHVSTILELQDWTRRLYRHGRYPCDPVRRYAIGIYQLHQATDWIGSASEDESNAACAIHTVSACEALDIPLEQGIAWENLVDIPFGNGSDRELLYHLSKLQAQIVYATNLPSIRRRSRFARGIASSSEARIVEILLGRIVNNKRPDALYTAMEIMQGEL
jgi:hypothetical protein